MPAGHQSTRSAGVRARRRKKVSALPRLMACACARGEVRVAPEELDAVGAGVLRGERPVAAVQHVAGMAPCPRRPRRLIPAQPSPSCFRFGPSHLRRVPQLVARGHHVTATTTSAAKLGLLGDLGAETVVVDGLDAVSVGEAVAKAGPDVVVHQMTVIAGKPDIGSHVAGPAAGRGSRGADDDRGARLLQCQGQTGARLGAALSVVATGLPGGPRVTRTGSCPTKGGQRISALSQPTSVSKPARSQYAATLAPLSCMRYTTAASVSRSM